MVDDYIGLADCLMHTWNLNLTLMITTVTTTTPLPSCLLLSYSVFQKGFCLWEGAGFHMYVGACRRKTGY